MGKESEKQFIHTHTHTHTHKHTHTHTHNIHFLITVVHLKQTHCKSTICQ